MRIKVEQDERPATDPVIWGDIPFERRLGWTCTPDSHPVFAVLTTGINRRTLLAPVASDWTAGQIYWSPA